MLDLWNTDVIRKYNFRYLRWQSSNTNKEIIDALIDMGDTIKLSFITGFDNFRIKDKQTKEVIEADFGVVLPDYLYITSWDGLDNRYVRTSEIQKTSFENGVYSVRTINSVYTFQVVQEDGNKHLEDQVLV